MRGREKFKKYRGIIIFLSKIMSVLPLNLRYFIFSSIRNMNGNKGLVLRYILIKTLTKKCGDNISIHPNVFLFNLKNLEIGNNVSIHPMCYIDSAGGIIIGNNVSIAHGVTILSSSHQFNDLETNIKDQSIIYKQTIIKDNVWLGAKSTILFGIILEQGSIIAAGAIVNRDVCEEMIVGGVPARIIKKR